MLVMAALVIVLLLLALLFGGLGFALHALWWVAVLLLIVWAVCMVIRASRQRL